MAAATSRSRGSPAGRGATTTTNSPQVTALASLGWEVKAVVVAHCDTLTSATTASCECVAAAHRLNELFASCQSREAAVKLASAICSLAVVVSLLNLLVEGAPPGAEIAVQLMSHLSVHPPACETLERAGVLPVLVAALRPDESLLRAEGLRLLAVLADVPSLAAPLVRAGTVKLLGVLAASTDPECWHWLLEICLGLLGSHQAVKPAQRRRLLELFEAAHACTQAGELALRPHDARALQRVLGVLRVLVRAAPSAAAKKAPPPEQNGPGRFGSVNLSGVG